MKKMILVFISAGLLVSAGMKAQPAPAQMAPCTPEAIEENVVAQLKGDGSLAKLIRGYSDSRRDLNRANKRADKNPKVQTVVTEASAAFETAIQAAAAVRKPLLETAEKAYQAAKKAADDGFLAAKDAAEKSYEAAYAAAKKVRDNAKAKARGSIVAPAVKNYNEAKNKLANALLPKVKQILLTLKDNYVKEERYGCYNHHIRRFVSERVKDAEKNLQVYVDNLKKHFGVD